MSKRKAPQNLSSRSPLEGGPYPQKLLKLLERLLRPLFRKLHSLNLRARSENIVCYYPRFLKQEDTENHYFRAAWYLPYLEAHCEQVVLFQNFTNDPSPTLDRPPYMCDDTGSLDHIRIKRGTFLERVSMLFRARVILAWKGYESSLVAWIAYKSGIPVVNVATEDANSREYGLYCGLFWKLLLSKDDRAQILAVNRNRFLEYSEEIDRRGYRHACVIGNGPTMERAFEIDFKDSLTILCNTAVGNRELMDHVAPDFVSAVDVVSHLGVSRQSQDFRDKLRGAMKESEFLFVTTAAFGYLLTIHHQDLKSRIILIEQSRKNPNLDLRHVFAAPFLDSVLNIIMLPLAATFCDDIWLLGCDGRSESRSNEDFWAHGEGSGYSSDLVQSGHLCHPVFDIHRQAITYDRYNLSVEDSISFGERERNISYRCFFPSNTPALHGRNPTSDWSSQMKNGQRPTVDQIGNSDH